MTHTEAARAAIRWHKEQAERGEVYRSCRLYDGEDSGPQDRRCWLIPGHQCACMTEGEARGAAVETPLLLVSVDNAATISAYRSTLGIRELPATRFEPFDLTLDWYGEPPMRASEGIAIFRVSPDDNAGKRVPPPRREWWASGAPKGHSTPGNGAPWNNPLRGDRGVKAHPVKKAARKAQKQARKGNRSK
jgi:hypothetical protein